MARQRESVLTSGQLCLHFFLFFFLFDFFNCILLCFSFYKWYNDRTKAQSSGWLNLLLVVWSEDGDGERCNERDFVCYTSFQLYAQYKHMARGNTNVNKLALIIR